MKKKDQGEIFNGVMFRDEVKQWEVARDDLGVRGSM